MGDAFSRYHPLVNFLFFALVLAYSMVLMHPVCLAVSLLGALLYAGQLEGRRALARHRGWPCGAAAGGPGESRLQPRGCHHSHLSALRQPPDAGEYSVWSGGGDHAVRRGAVVRVLQPGHHVGQICVSVWPGDPSPVPGAEHDPAVCAPVPPPAGNRAPGAVLHRAGRLPPAAHGSGPERPSPSFPSW